MGLEKGRGGESNLQHPEAQICGQKPEFQKKKLVSNVNNFDIEKDLLLEKNKTMLK